MNCQKNQCDLGITATLFNEKAEQVFQKTVGSDYSPMTGKADLSVTERYGPIQSGWTGDTSFAIFSNTKAFAAATYLSSVVDTGLGSLDEPLYKIVVPEVSISNDYANVTARMILSHSTGVPNFDRFAALDPYYTCKYNPTTTLEECVLGLIQSAPALNAPGTVAAYNNDPFDFLTLIISRKTGMKYTDAVAKYMTTPLGMTKTSYDCPAAISTSDKPQVAFGICTTGHDYPKFPQMLANNGLAPDGKRVLSLYSVQQMFSRGTGTALNGSEFILPSPGFIFSTCMARASYLFNSIMDYGLGVMFMPGNKGELFAHAGSFGGFWVVAPGRYSAYFASSSVPAISYPSIGLLLDMFERESTFMVSNNIPGVPDVWEELTSCGNGMFTELAVTPEFLESEKRVCS